MSFTHTNKVRYEYTAGAVIETKQTEGSETGSGEANVSKTWVLSASPLTVQEIEYFNFELKAQALSTFIMVAGCNGIIKDQTGTTLATLTNGVPQVWSKGSGTPFPVGSVNPMVDGITKLTFTPSGAGLAIENASVTLTIRVLFDAE